VVNALLDDPAVSALVGDRVYVGRGPFGGISKQVTPGAFDADGDLAVSVVVKLANRDRVAGRTFGRDAIDATQVIDLWVYDQWDYDRILDVVRACKRRLNGARDLRPVDDPVRWAETVWTGDGPEGLDQSFEPDLPFILSRYSARITDLLTEDAP
jgi:hypothetical protein